MLGWVNASILAGMAALAVPVIIHLLRNRRYRPAEIGSIRFLQQAVRETVRRRRLREKLLLLARLLIVALLTALFARPFVPRADSEPETDSEALLLIDRSGSLAGRTGVGTTSRLATEMARDALAGFPESARVTVGEFADTVREISDPDAASLRTAGKTDYAGALQWARDRLGASEAARREVVLITDLQRSGLPERPFADWPPELPVRILSVPLAGEFNAGISAVRCLTPYPRDETVLEVTIRCSGTVSETDIELVLDVSDAPAVRRTVPLRTGAVRFRVAGVPRGICRGRVRADFGDAWPADDTRPFAFRLDSPAKVVLVEGEPGATVYEDETYFLGMALKASEFAEGHSMYAVERRQNVGDLSGAAVVALCNVGTLSNRDVDALRGHLAAGGGIVHYAGDRTDPGGCDRLRDAGVFPDLQLRPAKAPVPRPLVRWDTTHPAFAAFTGAETGNLSRIIFREAFETVPGDASRVVCRLTADAPAVVVSSDPDRRLAVVLNPCDREWTDWPVERIFVPFTRELFAWLGRLDTSAVPVVERSAGLAEERAPGVYDADPVTVLAPDASEIPIEPVSEEEFRELTGIGPGPVGPSAAGAALLPAGRERRNELWRWLLAALLVIVFVENTLADRGKA